MYTRVPSQCLLCTAVFWLVSGVRAQAPPAPAQPSAAMTAPNDDLAQLDMGALVKRLPPAGLEWTFDSVTSNGTVDGASEEMRRRLVNGSLTDEQWRGALLGTGALRFRDRWPKGAEYAISITVPGWLGVAQIRVKPRLAALRDVEAGELMAGPCGTFTIMRARGARLGRPMGKLPDGVQELVFEVEVERGRSWIDRFRPREGGEPGILWKGSIARPVRLVDSAANVLPVAREPGIDAAVRDALGAGFRDWAGDREVPFVVVDPDCLKFPVLGKTALDIKVELLVAGKVVADTWLVAGDADILSLTGSISKARRMYYGSGNLDFDGDKSNTQQWVLRFMGRSTHFWCFWDAEQRWAGSLEIPWDEVVRHERERVGAEGRRPEIGTPNFR